jgi:hypothetical protein
MTSKPQQHDEVTLTQVTGKKSNARIESGSSSTGHSVGSNVAVGVGVAVGVSVASGGELVGVSVAAVAVGVWVGVVVATGVSVFVGVALMQDTSSC